MTKQFKLWMFAAILTVCGATAFTSCADEDNPCIEEEIPITHARVDSVYHIDEANLTVYIIEYPSIDPFGRPAMLSGTITIGDEVTADAPATGLLLYNHFTVYRADECPSRGELKVQKLIPGSGLITISADYYGFGIRPTASPTSTPRPASTPSWLPRSCCPPWATHGTTTFSLT